MDILIVGSGAREHALAAKIARSPLSGKLYCAPGNGGTSQIAENVAIAATDANALVAFAKKANIGLAVIGPEEPLVNGIVDAFEAGGIMAFGPRKAAAAFEGSKKLTKEFLMRWGVPTAAYFATASYSEAEAYLSDQSFPIVIKADGLAAGKGVYICESRQEASKALGEIMLEQRFGASGDLVVIEEFLTGEETSALCFADGKSLVPLESSKDYKRAYDADEGPNTGGMGAYSPNSIIDAPMADAINNEILNPIMQGFIAEGIDYRGILYVGLMITGAGPKVLEFNVRFGDPETQALMPRLKSDLVDIMLKCINGSLKAGDVEWSSDESVCIVIASEGYPDSYEVGRIISLGEPGGAEIFHAGTKLENGRLATSGGRVLSVSATGPTRAKAREKAYAAVQHINFSGMHYRKDIAREMGHKGN
ncbi:MAG: phosphoribosylamine--glycine ligase [Eubacteriaceae bacterium]|nr:phosphoribosylamine--glycine ligase [Eubacteriaceae bacterium]